MKDHPSEYVELDDQPDDQDQAEVDLVWERDVRWNRTDTHRITMTEAGYPHDAND
jgi:hypothetical protein